MMFFNTIKEETKDQIILANDLENIIISLILFILGLIVLWAIFEDFFTTIFNYSNTSYSFETILIQGTFVAFGGLCIWYGFKYLLFKSKAMIYKNHQKIIVERKSIMKCFESVREIYLRDIKEIEIKHKTTFEGHNSWDIYFVTNTKKSECFFSSSSESETKKLTDKICKIINSQIPIRESEVFY